jgi:hypothetical protein
LTLGGIDPLATPLSLRLPKREGAPLSLENGHPA